MLRALQRLPKPSRVLIPQPSSSALCHRRGVSTSKGEQGNAAENSLREKIESGFQTEFVSVTDVSGAGVV